MKALWVLVLVLALDVFMGRAGAQSATSTNFPVTGPAQSGMGVPSMVATNSSFGNAFQNTNGAQPAPAATNFFPTSPSQNGTGVPSTVATNQFFGSAFQRTNSAQTATATNSFPSAPSQSGTGPQTIATNPFFASAPQVGVEPTTTTTNFLFASSAKSWVGQGQSLFAAATNGYEVRLYQVSPNILDFNISPTNSGSTNWSLEFSCTNDVFTVGTYSNAVNAGGSPARLIFGGMGRGDNTSGGFFNVLEATYSSNQLASFAADFVQYDNSDTNSWNEGSIRFNSAIPDTVNLLSAPVAISFQNKNAVVTWSTNLVGFQLEYATNVPSRRWFTNNTVPIIIDGQYTVTNAISGGARLFRLMRPL